MIEAIDISTALKSDDQTLESGKTYSLGAGEYEHVIRVAKGAKVTLNVTGNAVYTKYSEFICVQAGAELTINAEGAESRIASKSCVIKVESGATVTVHGVTVEHAGQTTEHFTIDSDGGTVNIEGGTIAAEYVNGVRCKGGAVNFKSGTIKCNGEAIDLEECTVTIGSGASITLYAGQYSGYVFLKKDGLLHFDNYSGDPILVSVQEGKQQVTTGKQANMIDKITPGDPFKAIKKDNEVWLIAPPSVSASNLVYTGAEQKPEFKVSDSDYKVTGAVYYSDWQCTTPATVKDAGTYYAKVTVSNGIETMDVSGVMFTVAPATPAVEEFNITVSGKAPVNNEVTVAAGEQLDVSAKYKDTEDELRSYFSFDKAVQTDKPGDYVVNVSFNLGESYKNLTAISNFGTWTIHVVAKPITDIDSDNPGLTVNPEGVLILNEGYTLDLKEKQVDKPIGMKKDTTILSGLYTEFVLSDDTGYGTIEGGTFTGTVEVGKITGGVFAKKPSVEGSIGLMDMLKLADREGDALNNYAINTIIKPSEASAIALFAENGPEENEDVQAYIVGDQKLKVEYTGDRPDFYGWKDSDGKTYRGKTAELAVSAAGKTITLTALYAADIERTITVENGTMTVNGEKRNTVKVGETVALTPDEAPDGMTFQHWDIPQELMQALSDAGESKFDNKDPNLTFKMPLMDEDASTSFTIKAMYGTPDTVDEGPSVLGTVATAAVGTAAVGILGWQVYSLASQSYLELVLPEGAVIPANRQELALLLWNDAGKPEVEAAPYTDVEAAATDAQKATHWAVAEGLMDEADKDNEQVFNPAKTVSKWTIIKAWNKAQKLKKQ